MIQYCTLLKIVESFTIPRSKCSAFHSQAHCTSLKCIALSLEVHYDSLAAYLPWYATSAPCQHFLLQCSVHWPTLRCSSVLAAYALQSSALQLHWTSGCNFEEWTGETFNFFLKSISHVVCTMGLVQKKWSQSVTWRSKNQSQKWCLGFIFLENVYLMIRLSYGQGQEKWGRLHFFWTRPVAWVGLEKWYEFTSVYSKHC